jgi:N-acyl-L-homoserine lactone synthetase
LPDGLERNGDDERAVHLVGCEGAELAATSRLVPPSAAGRLPLEELFGLSLEPEARLAELDRIVVAAAHRDGGHAVLAGLLGGSWLEARERGFRGVVGIVSTRLLDLYEELGVRLRVLGEARRYWGEDRFPVRIDLRGTLAD